MTGLPIFWPFGGPLTRFECYSPNGPCSRPVAGAPGVRPMHHLLIVDDDPHVRRFCVQALDSPELRCEQVGDGLEALAAFRTRPFDLVLLDIDMPGMKGPDVCLRLRAQPPCPHLKIVMISGRASADEMSEIMLASADDYLNKPFTVLQLHARVKAALRLKDAQDRSDSLNKRLLAANHELEETLSARDSDLVQA